MFKRWLLAAAITLGGLASSVHAEDVLVLFGTQQVGPTRGFYLSHFDTETGKLTVPTFEMRAEGPGYFVITADGKHLYTCNSIANYGGATHMGAVSAYGLDPKTGKMTLLNQLASGGENPAYISLDKTGKYALVAHYQGNRVAGEGGNVSVFAIKPDGSFGERTAFDQHKGTSINPQRQTQAYAHSIITDPSNKFALCPDLGLDKVVIYKFDEKTGGLTANDPAFAALKQGTGPRHMTFHPNGKVVYVIQEMGSMITAFNWDGEKGSMKTLQEISTLPEDFKGTNSCAEIRITPDGKTVYGSNRGQNAIAQFSVDPATFKLTLVGTVPSGGNMPRNFEFDASGKWMIVTNHDSNNAVVFKVDQASGKLTQVGEPVAVTYPFCPRFIPVPKP